MTQGTDQTETNKQPSDELNQRALIYPEDEQRAQRLQELDTEYSRHTKHLQQVVKEARARILGFNRQRSPEEEAKLT